MAGNEKLRSVCSAALNAYTDSQKALDVGKNQKFSARRQFALEIADQSAHEKFDLTFKRLVNLIPKDKKAEAHAKVEALWKSTFSSEESYERRKRQILGIPDAFPTQEDKDIFLFHRPMSNFVFQKGPEVFEVVLNALDGLELDDVAEELANYESPAVSNVKQYPFADTVAELKKKNAETITDQQKLNELNEELDIIARGVITSPEQYCKNQDNLEVKASHDVNLENDEINNRQLEGEQYGELKRYFKEATDGFSYGVREFKDEYRHDVDIAKEFLKPDRKFILPKDKKQALLNILKLMKERGILEYGKLGIGESNDKEYSFMQISQAHKKLEAMLKAGSTDVEALRQARQAYETSLQNMRDVYKMIEEQIGPDETMSIGNLSSYRTKEVPNEFKNNIFVNSYANAIYNIGCMAEAYGASFEELVDDPSATFFKFFGEMTKNLTANDYLQQKSTLKGAISSICNGDSANGYPYTAVGRNAEFLKQLSVGSEFFEQNNMAMMLTATYDARVMGLVQNYDISAPAGFFRLGDPAQTCANMLLVNPEDRDYNKLRSFEALTADGRNKIPPFNAVDYFETHKVDPAGFIERANSTLDELVNEGGYHPPQVRMALVIRVAQVAAYEFMLVHPTPDVEADNGFFTKEQFDELKAIVNTPEKAFEKFMTKDLSEEKARFRSMSDYSKGIEHTGEAALKGTELSKEEKAYCRKIEDIKKSLTGKEAEAAISALLAKEIERLENDEKAFSKELRDEMAKHEPMRDYIKNIERTGKDALKTACKEARAAEKAYGKQVDNIKKTLTGKEAEIALADLRTKEIERLEKAYCEGKLPSDYFEQRRFNVEQGKENRTVHFGASEQPSFFKFKMEHAKEFKGMSAEDMQTLYDRMMDNARRAENKFMLTAAGKQPKPTVERAEPVEVKETQNLREHIDVYHDLNDNVVDVSKPIVHDNPQLNITKNP